MKSPQPSPPQTGRTEYRVRSLRYRNFGIALALILLIAIAASLFTRPLYPTLSWGMGLLADALLYPTLISWVGAFNSKIRIGQIHIMFRSPQWRSLAIKFDDLDTVTRRGHDLRFVLKDKRVRQFNSRDSVAICEALRKTGFSKIEERGM